MRGKQNRPATGAKPNEIRLLRTKPLLVIAARANGIGPLRFVVDTGASLCVLSPAAAVRVGLVAPARQHAKAIGAGGSVEASIGKLKLLEIDTLSISNLEFAIMPLGVLNRTTRLRLDGVLGYNLLSRYRVIIDYRNRMLTFQ
jgi:predicted aspartyl protease